MRVKEVFKLVKESTICINAQKLIDQIKLWEQKENLLREADEYKESSITVGWLNWETDAT